MGRPPARDLTERELEVMHIFWKHGKATAAESRDRLAASGLDRTYTTIANLVRTLEDKGFLHQINAERPFVYRPARSYEEVTGRCLATWSSASSGARDRSCSTGWSSNVS